MFDLVLDFIYRPWVMGGLVVGLMASLIAAEIADHCKWEAFAKAHDCIQVAQSEGNLLSTVGTSSNGQVVIGTLYVPGTVTYRCNDGKSYTRSK